MTEIFEPLLVVIILLNLFQLGTSRLRAVIGASALQGIALAFLAITAHGGLSVTAVVASVLAIAVKTILIPRLLYKAMRDANIQREVEPSIGYVASLLLGAAGTCIAVAFARSLPVVGEHKASLLMPASFATILTGFIIITTRRKAITQVVGYLVLENGIFIMGLALIAAMPFIIELGVLLDLVVGIFVFGIIVNHISREFSSTDVDQLTKLQD
jgi:hydrogenase-4 component E